MERTPKAEYTGNKPSSYGLEVCSNMEKFRKEINDYIERHKQISNISRVRKDKGSNPWYDVKNFLNRKQNGYVFLIREIGPTLGYKTTQIGTQLSYLKQLGYIENTARGAYKLIKKVPMDLMMKK